MKHIFVIVTMVFLLGCRGGWVGTTHSVQIPKLNSVSAALAFLRTHPAIKTTGVPLAPLLAELDIHPNKFGRHINADRYLVIERLQVAGKARRLNAA